MRQVRDPRCVEGALFLVKNWRPLRCRRFNPDAKPRVARAPLPCAPAATRPPRGLPPARPLPSRMSREPSVLTPKSSEATCRAAAYDPGNPMDSPASTSTSSRRTIHTTSPRRARARSGSRSRVTAERGRRAGACRRAGTRLLQGEVRAISSSDGGPAREPGIDVTRPCGLSPIQRVSKPAA
jgi:hypothetical protein